MSDQSPHNPPPSNSPSDGQTQPPEAPAPTPSLRETIEAAYDNPDQQVDAGQDGRVRDSYGRFVAKDRVESGEAEKPKAPPSPEKPITGTQKPTTDPAPQGSSSQPPEHWSAEDKATFAKLPTEGQSFLLRRHQEMEADYTRKSQTASGAVQFAQSLSPVFDDPAIAGSLRQSGFNAVDAVQQWASFHKRAITPDPREQVGLLVELSQRMGLDPARLFVGMKPPPDLSPEDMKDPAIRYFADHMSRTTGEMQALKARLQEMVDTAEKQREQEAVDVAMQNINQFEHEKDASGNPLRPHFNRVINDIVDLFRINPERGMQDAYLRAVRMNEDLYQETIAAERNRLQSQSSVDRARAASRGNTRGLTSPVSKPNAKTGNGTLRDMLEQTADEVGFN
jgi:hypothetical protein